MSLDFGLRVSVGEILGRPGKRRAVRTQAELELAVTGAQVVGEVEVDLVLEAILGGLTATGTLSAPYEATCRRCLVDIQVTASIEVHEIFEAEPVEGESYPLDRDHVDLEPLVRDAVLPELPAAALCADGCRGPDPERYPALSPDDEEVRRDPRWAALDALVDDDPA